MPAKKKAAEGGGGEVHVRGEDYPWKQRIPEHPRRTESRQYRASRKVTNEKSKLDPDWYYGEPPYECHHGGGLWLKDEDGWFMVRNLAGMEWSSQFCADPAKVDALRVNARRVYAAFPEAVEELGIRELLDTPITDAEGVARWTDSICNASVALPRPLHTGVLPKFGGIHHYPSPVAEIALFKYDDFELWQLDGEQRAVAVVPVAERGSGDGTTMLAYVEPGSALEAEKAEADAKGEAVFLPPDDLLSAVAFKEQDTKLFERSVTPDDPLFAMMPNQD